MWWVVIARSVGSILPVRFRTTNTVCFNSRHVQISDLLYLGCPNLDPYTRIRRCCLIWLDLSVPVSGFEFPVVLFKFPIRDLIVYRKMLAMVCCCLFWMYLILSMGPANPPVVRVWTGKPFRFSCRPIQKSKQLSLSGVGIQTRHKPAVFWPALLYSRAYFSQTQNCGSN